MDEVCEGSNVFLQGVFNSFYESREQAVTTSDCSKNYTIIYDGGMLSSFHMGKCLHPAEKCTSSYVKDSVRPPSPQALQTVKLPQAAERSSNICEHWHSRMCYSVPTVARPASSHLIPWADFPPGRPPVPYCNVAAFQRGFPEDVRRR